MLNSLSSRGANLCILLPCKRGTARHAVPRISSAVLRRGARAGAVTDTLEKSIKNNKSPTHIFSPAAAARARPRSRASSRKALGVSDKDLYEIDAASNRGIDNIRELREGVQTDAVRFAV